MCGHLPWPIFSHTTGLQRPACLPAPHHCNTSTDQCVDRRQHFAPTHPHLHVHAHRPSVTRSRVPWGVFYSRAGVCVTVQAWLCTGPDMASHATDTAKQRANKQPRNNNPTHRTLQCTPRTRHAVWLHLPTGSFPHATGLPTATSLSAPPACQTYATCPRMGGPGAGGLGFGVGPCAPGQVRWEE